LFFGGACGEAGLRGGRDGRRFAAERIVLSWFAPGRV
jgi:hypothetical protein